MNSTLKKLAVKSVLSLAMVFTLAFAAVGVSASYNTSTYTGTYETVVSTYNSSDNITASMYAQNTNTCSSIAQLVRAKNIKKNIGTGAISTINSGERTNVSTGGYASKSKTGVSISNSYRYGAEGYEEVYHNGSSHSERRRTYSHN